ncbi:MULTISPECIES: hypothetical protein [Pirellulaceae]|nr:MULTISPECIES: hypothetical protein [Pirellulaceae]
MRKSQMLWRGNSYIVGVLSMTMLVLTAAGCAAESFGGGNREPSPKPGRTFNPKLNRIGTGSGFQRQQIVAAVQNEDVNFTQIEEIRRKFWKTKPGEADYDALRKQFAEVLVEKDIQLLHAAATTSPNNPNKVFAKITMNATDGGVPDAALPAFNRWVKAIRKHLGIREGVKYQGIEDAKASDLKRLAAAAEATDHFAKQYETMRDWAEYLAAGRQEDFYPTPESYALFVLLTDGDGMTTDEATSKLNELIKKTGKEVLLEAADRQRKHPKTQKGLLQGSKSRLLTELMKELKLDN